MAEEPRGRAEAEVQGPGGRGRGQGSQGAGHATGAEGSGTHENTIFVNYFYLLEDVIVKAWMILR